jgi:hypothetical protein
LCLTQLSFEAFKQVKNASFVHLGQSAVETRFKFSCGFTLQLLATHRTWLLAAGFSLQSACLWAVELKSAKKAQYPFYKSKMICNFLTCVLLKMLAYHSSFDYHAQTTPLLRFMYSTFSRFCTK